uniref:Oxygen-regulated protein 1 n=1 Tax=Vombatus ursinus TaxID=29139 RepID=A0A4X2K827_VOMUR
MSETPSTNFSMIHAASSEGQASYPRHFNVTQPVVAKRISFYKSGDPQFSGIQMVVNPRSFKTFDALLDNLSRKVPLPFGVRNISTPRGIHSITKLEDLEDGRSYICSHRKKIQPIDLEKARQKPLPWQSTRPLSARRRAAQLARAKEFGPACRELPVVVQTPRKLLVFKNGDPRTRHIIILSRKITQNFEAFLEHLTELMQYPVVKLYTTDGRKVPSLQAVILSSGAVVAAGREPFKPGNYDLLKYLLPDQLPRTSKRIYPKGQTKPEGRKSKPSSPRSQIYSLSSDKIYSNDCNSDCSLAPDNYLGLEKNDSQACEDISIVPSEDDIEKSILVNQDGTMTVEMNIRFKIREEEMVKWTTTVRRVGLLNGDKKSETCGFPIRTEDQSPAIESSTCTQSTDVPFLEKCENEEDNLAKETNSQVTGRESDIYNGAVWENTPVNTDVSEMPQHQVKHRFHRPPTPGPRRVRQKKSRVESITLVSETEVEEKMIGQFSYSEEREDGEGKSEYHMFTHSSSKMSSVTNKPKLAEFNSENLPKASLESKTEDRLFLSSPKSGDLVEITSQKTLEVAQNDSLSQIVQDKSVMEEGIVCMKNIMPYDTINDRIRPLPADITHFCVSGSGTELSHGETISEVPTSMDPSTVTTNIDKLVSEFAQCGLRSTPTSERLILPSGPKKKKGKKSHLQVVNSEQSQLNRENAIKRSLDKNEKVDFNSETIQEAMSPSSHCTERTVVLQVGSKKAANRTVYANGVSSKSNLDLTISKTLPSTQVPAARRIKNNGLFSGKAKHKAVKKMSFAGSIKKESSLEKKDFPQNDIKYCKNTFGIEDAHHILKVRNQVPKSFYVRKSVAAGYMIGTEKKNIFSKVNNLNTSLKNQKKQKLGKLKSDTVENKQHSRTWDHSLTSLKKIDFPDDIAHHSVQNYIQTWLQNVFPPPTLPSEKITPLNKKEGDIGNYTDNCFPHLIQAVSGKESEDIIENKAQTSMNPPLEKYNFDEVATESPINQNTVEVLAKEVYERQIRSLTDASLGEQVTPSVFLEYDTKIQAAKEETQDSTKNSELGPDPQGKKPDFRRQSVEAAVQVSAGDSSVIITNLPKDLLSGLLFHQIQAFVLNLQKSQNGTAKISCPLSDFSSLSSPLRSVSTNLILAWLMLLNLKGSLEAICQDDDFNTTSKSSEIFTLLEFLKHIAIAEKADDLKTAVSHLKESATTCLGLIGKEQVPVDVSANSSADEIQNVTKHSRNENAKEARDLYEADSVKHYGTEEAPISHKACALSNAFSPTEDFILDQTCSLDEPCFLEEDFSHNEGEEESETCPSVLPCPLEEAHVMSMTCIPNDILNSEEKTDNLELIEELERLDRLQEDLIMSEELNDLSIHELAPLQNENMGNLSNCSPFPNEAIMELSEKQEEISLAEFQNGLLNESQDKNTDMSFDKEDSRTSEEPGSTTNSMTSGERNISELESFEEIENQDKTNFNVQKNVGGHANLGTREKTKTNENPELTALSDGGIVEEEKRNDESYEKRLTKPPSLVFCYDSKQSPEKDTHKGETNVQVKMKVNNRNHSNPSLGSRKCLKSPVISDWSDYRPDTESEPTYKTSSDLTNESGDEIVQEREYNTGFVKRTIEKLYGEEAIKPCLLIGPTNSSQAFQASSLESTQRAQKASPYNSQCQTFNSPQQVSHHSPTLQSSWEEGMCGSITCAEDSSFTPSVNGVKVNHHEQDGIGHCMEQYNHAKPVRGTDEGVLIDKGKWLLKENHLLRLSSLDNTGMYGNAETTSADTLLDNNSDEIPYSHFGNLDQGPALADISSSELEEMAQPLEPRSNYFNMPHGSDSDPFHDDSLGIQNKTVNADSIPSLHEKMKDNQQPSKVCTALTCVYTMPGNKVHPVGHPGTDGPIKSQPSPLNNRNSAILQEGDSLDKLYAVCGQHCPILTAVIQPVNENDRGFVYRKASDIENFGDFHLWTSTLPHLLWSNNNSFRDENNNVSMKKTHMDNTSSDTFARFYLNSTLDLIKRRGFGIFNSSATEHENYLKECETHSRKVFYVCFLQTQLFVMDNMNLNKQGSSNQGDEISIAVDENNNLLNNRCQSSRAQEPNEEKVLNLTDLESNSKKII